MIPDSEIIGLVCTILTRLDVGEFIIKVSKGQMDIYTHVVQPAHELGSHRRSTTAKS